MGAFAEFERALIRERQKEGIALAKQRGVYRVARMRSHPVRLSRYASGLRVESKKHHPRSWDQPKNPVSVSSGIRRLKRILRYSGEHRYPGWLEISTYPINSAE
jgi:DNA invertase Pin-like site-specific DNA recombinase